MLKNVSPHDENVNLPSNFYDKLINGLRTKLRSIIPNIPIYSIKIYINNKRNYFRLVLKNSFQQKDEKMSSLLGSIFGTLGNLFGNFLPSWGRDQASDDIRPVLHDLPVNVHPVNEDHGDSGSSSEYDTADEGENTTNEEDYYDIPINRRSS
ncbi:hypothetical protein RhiirA4_476102 [Rhizophagus irregularis]|uniref:Uncharacterized protein n=1 Tax=Rhizophagus irregularis TaxID=588596 RepID=A0A2I1HB11_9GLOM|nr:hypothetical protein RhiirA4_476102 [Rhizophagus irregularis]